MKQNFSEFLAKYKTFVFVGNGGTGKTTLSASWAIEAAKTGKKVGLLTIDPSKRLGDVFSMDLEKETFKQASFGAGQVDIHLIDSQKVIEEFVTTKFSAADFAQLKKNRIFAQVSSVLSENQSVSTIYKLNELISNNKYDIFVVDTPPSNNSMDFFTAPDSVIRIFKENILARAASEAKSFKFWSAQKIFYKVFTFLVGEDFYNEVEIFFKTLFSFQEHIVSSSGALTELLKSTETCFFLVTLPNEAKVQEVLEVAKSLHQQGIRHLQLIINRAYPDWLDLQKTPDKTKFEDAALQNYYDKLFKYYHNQTEATQRMAEGMDKGIHIYFIPEKMVEMQTVGLEQVSHNLMKGFQ
jgi:anion-transporting  ArsA/GET3 family ATPase